MRIGLDFNGVIADSSVTKIRLAKQFLGINLSYAQTAKRSLNGALSEEDYDHLQKLVYWTSELLTTPARSGAVPAIAAQLTAGHEVYCITHLAPEGVQFGKQWLAERDLPRGMLISVGRGGDKRWVLNAGFDVYVDDRVTTLAASTVRHKILLSTPYNRADPLSHGIVRVADMEELTSYLRVLQRQEYQVLD